MDKRTTDLTRDEKIARQASDLNALRTQQIAEANGEEETEYVEGNRNPKFKIRELEAKAYVHVWTRIRNLSQDQKSFIDEDKIVKIHAREFDKRVKDGAFKPFDEVEVIHDPRKGAPKLYELKPDQVNVDAQVQGIGRSNYREDLSPEQAGQAKAQIMKEAARIDAKNSQLKDREADLNSREAALKAREENLEKDLLTLATKDPGGAQDRAQAEADLAAANLGARTNPPTPDLDADRTKGKKDDSKK